MSRLVCLCRSIDSSFQLHANTFPLFRSDAISERVTVCSRHNHHLLGHGRGLIENDRILVNSIQRHIDPTKKTSVKTQTE